MDLIKRRILAAVRRKFSKAEIADAKRMVLSMLSMLEELELPTGSLRDYVVGWSWPELSDELADVIEEVRKAGGDDDILDVMQATWDALPVDEEEDLGGDPDDY